MWCAVKMVTFKKSHDGGPCVQEAQDCLEAVERSGRWASRRNVKYWKAALIVDGESKNKAVERARMVMPTSLEVRIFPKEILIWACRPQNRRSAQFDSRAANNALRS